MAQEGWNLDQDNAGCQHSEGPLYCVNNCGLVGNPATMNLCTKCYLAVVLKEPDLFPAKVVGDMSVASTVSEQPLVVSTHNEEGSLKDSCAYSQDAAIPLAEPVATHDDWHLSSESESTLPEQSGPSAVQHHRHSSRLVNRCSTCRKRLGLTGFKCRCGDMFCSLHRYSDRHFCSFDYKAAARDAIAKANPLIKAGKIEKI